MDQPAEARPAGVITLNKPTGITSAKALYRVRKITRVRKSGHAGTLDPAADGVLVLCLGKATGLVEREAVYKTVERKFGGKSPEVVEKNVEAIDRAVEEVVNG